MDFKAHYPKDLVMVLYEHVDPKIDNAFVCF